MNFLKRSSLVFIFCIIPTFYSAFSMQQFSRQERGKIETVVDGFAEKVFDILIRSAFLPPEIITFLVQHEIDIKDGSREIFHDRLLELHGMQFSFLKEKSSDGIRGDIVQDLSEQWEQSLLDAVGAERPEFVSTISQRCFPRMNQRVREIALQKLKKIISHPRNYVQEVAIV